METLSDITPEWAIQIARDAYGVFLDRHDIYIGGKHFYSFAFADLSQPLDATCRRHSQEFAEFNLPVYHVSSQVWIDRINKECWCLAYCVPLNKMAISKQPVTNTNAAR